MTTTRTVANTAAPLVDPGGGTVRNGTRVQFTLVNAATLEPCSAFDATTGEEISGTKAVTTTSGVFSAALWPNDRGTPATKYLCTINAPNFTPFSGIVREEDLSTLPFVDFFSDGQVLTPAQIGLLYEHIADFSVHITSAQNTFLDALNLPTLTAAHVNFTTGLTSNAQTQLDAKAPLADPVFTGDPRAPTRSASDNDTSIATTAYVTTAISNLALAATYQPLDADLTAISALVTTGYLMRTAPNTWVLSATIALADLSGATNLQAIEALGAPAADRVLFYDQSAGGYRHLTVGTNLAIVGTTLNASGTLVDGIEEAPGDGERYARADGAWEKLARPIVTTDDVIVDSGDGLTALHPTWSAPVSTFANGGAVRAHIEGKAFNESGDGDHDIEFQVSADGYSVLQILGTITLAPGTYNMEVDLILHANTADEKVRGMLRVALSSTSLAPTVADVYLMPISQDVALGTSPTPFAISVIVSGSSPANNKVIAQSSSFHVE